MSPIKVKIAFIFACLIYSFSFTQTDPFTRITEGAIVNDADCSYGCIWGDYDNDGDLDLFVANGGNNAMYFNNGDVTFEKITEGIIVNDGGDSRGCSAGDYDNDGDLDLFVANHNQDNCLYANNGDGTFTKITEGAIVNDGGKSRGCSWGDYDNDGDLDLFVANFEEKNFLYSNNGNGTFAKITEGIIVDGADCSNGCSWGDYDNDGDLDLFVANYKDNSLYANNGDGSFTKITEGAIVHDSGDSYGSSWGDYDNDGDLDLFVANLNVLGSNYNKNFLYTNNGDGSFTKIIEDAVVNDLGYSYGGGWGDFDNDGDLDLFVANLKKDNFMYKNNGDGSFTKITDWEVVNNGGISLGCCWGDYDNDGYLDLFVANSGDNFLYKNNGDDNNWITIKCVGTMSNVSAIGAKVKVKANVYGSETWQMQEISGQTSCGAQNSLNAEFGLGNASIIDSIKIEWPSRNVDILTNISVNQFLTVTEEPEQFTKITKGEIVNDVGRSTGCSWGDYDNDGDIDLVVANGNENNFLYNNNGDGSFTKITEGIIVNDGGNSNGCSWGDYDNDGDLDLFVANWNSWENNYLYSNNGDGTFTKITDGAIVNDGGSSAGCCWGDYDNDGDLDLFVTNIFGKNNLLYANNGDGTFTKITEGTIVNDGGDSRGCSWGDYDNDGDLDLFVANLYKSSFLYANNGNGTFSKITEGDIVNDGGYSFGGSWGDYDNDGDLDLFVAHYSDAENNLLYTNNGDGTFTKIIEGVIVNDGGYSVGSSWGDYDNDGDVDLFVANEIEDNFLYANNGDGTFTKITVGDIVNDDGISYGCGWADYDNDGDIDLFVATHNEDNFLYANNGNANNWINVKCVGSHSNISAIGAKVKVKVNIQGNPVWQLQEISGQTGYNAQNSLNAEFGLGDATIVDSIKIEWPLGTSQILTDIAVNQFLTVTEESKQFTKITAGDIVDDEDSSRGCSWGDYDNDGDLELFVTNWGNNSIYANNGNGTFTKITEGIIVNDGGYSFSCSWADYDNDDDLDLFVANTGENNFLYVNKGDGSFTKITEGIIVNDRGKSYGSSWGDYNNDGDLDLFVANVDGKNFLYTNNGYGAFTKTMEGAIANDDGDSFGCSWGDYDNDGDLDLFVVNGGYYYLNNFFYTNNGDGTFTKITEGIVVNDDGFSNGCSWGDYDNDGDLDLFVANEGNNFLYNNNGDGTFTKITEGIVVNDGGRSLGCSWGDYDNDGDLDLFVTNWDENNCLYANNGDGSFAKITNEIVTNDGGKSYGCCYADFDNDGDLDLFISNHGNNFLYKNNGNFNNWINIKCVGTTSNTSAIGAKVKLKATINGNPIWQMHEISGQTGCYAQNSLNAEFGLGDATVIDSIKIEWPSGIHQNLSNVAVNQFLTVSEHFEQFTKITEGDIVNNSGDFFGSSWGDYDNDGDLDLFVANLGDKNLLYVNNGDGTFTKITDGAIVNDESDSPCGSWGDYDNDGDLDLFV
ncbi:VCBS repeat-containing protein, partial [candidate division KSB1 bacterium]|nr:VCBS repeat-containing protein [candidate division KSB1 bacterium]